MVDLVLLGEDLHEQWSQRTVVLDQQQPRPRHGDVGTVTARLDPGMWSLTGIAHRVIVTRGSLRSL